MRTITPVLILGLLLLAQLATAATRERSVCGIRFHGKTYTTKISDKAFKKYPIWEPEKEPCPLPLSKAVELARTYLRSRFPTVLRWELEDVSIDRFSEGKWYYQITLDDKNPEIIGDDEAGSNVMTVLVCFNDFIPEIEEAEH